MTNNTPATPASKDSIVASLSAAAHAALLVTQAESGDKAHKLYLQYTSISLDLMNAIQSDLKAGANLVALTKIQSDLDDATGVIKKNLDTLKDVQKWIAILDSVVQVAAKVAPFFV